MVFKHLLLFTSGRPKGDLTPVVCKNPSEPNFVGNFRRDSESSESKGAGHSIGVQLQVEILTSS
jgi:hypothetical protein